MFYSGNWIHSFPRHYQWSNAILVTKGMAPWGVVAMDEIDRVTQRLHARIDEPHAWHEEWSAMAARTSAYNQVAGRPNVDPARVAIMAYSAGGYYAPRAAAFEPCYAACVAWGPHYDYHAVWQKRWETMQQDGNSVATSHFQLPWVLGVADMAAAMEKLKKFTLAGVAERIRCPMLICWGEQDNLTPREVAHQLPAAVSSRDKTLKIFTPEEGGAEHCQVDNRQVGTDYIADWLAARLMHRQQRDAALAATP